LLPSWLAHPTALGAVIQGGLIGVLLSPMAMSGHTADVADVRFIINIH